jgi:DNA-binding transcriptional ArsR family regulator
MKVDRSDAATWASWFRALGDPSRILILNLLARRSCPLSLGEIVKAARALEPATASSSCGRLVVPR